MVGSKSWQMACEMTHCQAKGMAMTTCEHVFFVGELCMKKIQFVKNLHTFYTFSLVFCVLGHIVGRPLSVFG